MDGIPQPSITISKSRPIGWPAPPHLKRSRLTVTMPGDRSPRPIYRRPLYNRQQCELQGHRIRLSPPALSRSGTPSDGTGLTRAFAQGLGHGLHHRCRLWVERLHYSRRSRPDGLQPPSRALAQGGVFHEWSDNDTLQRGDLALLAIWVDHGGKSRRDGRPKSVALDWLLAWSSR